MRKLLAVLLALIMVASCMGCSCSSEVKQEEVRPEEVRPEENKPEPADQNKDTWAIWVYLCGSNLESDYGNATQNLGELDTYVFPEGVTAILETGGTPVWHNSVLDPDYLERWEFRRASSGSNSMNLVEQLPLSNMEEESTFEDFLRFCKDNYPAEHVMMIVWDHGGGTTGGVCNDFNYMDDGNLAISEMQKAFKNVFGENPGKKPLDILGFDCCLMATLDVAAAFDGYADYLIASEETIPGSGWDYSEIIKTLVNNPQYSPAQFAAAVCNGYYEKYHRENKEGSLTISITDLNKVEPLVQAYEQLGKDLVKEVAEDPDSFIELAMNAAATENYGGNSRSQGYVNYIDLFGFASGYSDRLESAKQVLKTLDDCVIYNSTGAYRSGSYGLSVYYPYDGDREKLEILENEGVSRSFKSLYAFASGKELSEDNIAFLKENGIDPENLPNIKTFNSLQPERPTAKLNSEGHAYADFGPDVGTAAIDVMINLFAYADDGDIYFLGTDDEIKTDFNQGIFVENFGGRWLIIDGWLAYVNLDYDSNTYNLYSVPVLYNEQVIFLQRGYNFETNEWEDLGARWASDDPGMSRAFYLDEGTPITILQKVWDFENETFNYVRVGDTVYYENMFEYKTLPTGNYAMNIMLEDSFRHVVYSKTFDFYFEDGQYRFDLESDAGIQLENGEYPAETEEETNEQNAA